MKETFERGVVIISIDTEQIWGYFDALSQAQFEQRFPDARAAHEKLLICLRAAGVSATWFVVGGLTLRQSAGAGDPRIAALAGEHAVSIPRGSESTAPLWYRPSFVDQLRRAQPAQEIGLHGGLTHLVWTNRGATREIVRRELAEGIEAMSKVCISPSSFSFARNQEAHHDLLPQHGISCFRGRPPALAWRLGRSFAGAILRASDELLRTTPPPVWPQKIMPGLWNIPSSTFLYPIGPARTRVVGLRSRVERFARGMQAAARYRGIFHLSLHPENLTESPHGFSMFEDMLDRLGRARDQGDVEVMTMSDVVACMERKQLDASQSQQSNSKLLKADRRS